MCTVFNEKQGYAIVPYLDDYGGADTPNRARLAFQTLRLLFKTLNLVENEQKASAPCTKMIFLGIEIDSYAFTLTIPHDKLHVCRQLLREWLEKSYCLKRQLQSLIGKLMHISSCIRGGRIFLNRMLNVLREAGNVQQNERIKLSQQFRKDVQFFYYFMTHFNGVAIMKELYWSTPDGVFASDASLSGLGGINFQNAEYYFLTLNQTPHVLEKIHVLEMLALITCCKLWGPSWSGQRLIARCDNMCTVLAINTGKSKDMRMQACLRELFYWMSMFSFEIKSEYINTRDNTLPDLLSRFSDKQNRKVFNEKSTGLNLKQVPATINLLEFTHQW